MSINRALSVAAVAGATAALLADLLLQGALAAVRIDASGWSWLPATLLDRGRWVIVAALLLMASPRLAASNYDSSTAIAPAGTRSSAFEIVGRGMVLLPLFWVVATWFMRAIRITIDRGWPYEGHVFLTLDFYAVAIVQYAPGALGGLMIIALSRHIRLSEGGDG